MSKIVDQLTHLTKEYVELQSKYEKTKEELNQERMKQMDNLPVLHVTKVSSWGGGGDAMVDHNEGPFVALTKDHYSGLLLYG